MENGSWHLKKGDNNGEYFTTCYAVKRRKIILNTLENEGEKDTADIIDDLKKLNKIFS